MADESVPVLSTEELRRIGTATKAGRGYGGADAPWNRQWLDTLDAERAASAARIAELEKDRAAFVELVDQLLDLALLGGGQQYAAKVAELRTQLRTASEAHRG